MADLGQLSRRELLAIVVAQAELIGQQDARIAELSEQVADLARRLGQNSSNSSLPPSSDRFAKPKRHRRKGSGRKPGKQPGAPGATLELVADPDEVIDHQPQACGDCGGELATRRRPGCSCGRCATCRWSRSGWSSTARTSGPAAVAR